MVYSIFEPYRYIYCRGENNEPIFPGHIEAQLRTLQNELSSINKKINYHVRLICELQMGINKIDELVLRGKANARHLVEITTKQKAIDESNEFLKTSRLQERRDELYRQICDLMNDYEESKNKIPAASQNQDTGTMSSPRCK